MPAFLMESERNVSLCGITAAGCVNYAVANPNT